jgi:large subunit ribosomal protein L6
MVSPEVREIVRVPKEVNVTIAPDGLVTVKGKNGELKRTFYDPAITIKKEGETVIVHSNFPRRKTRALAGTFAAHIKNMVQGVQKDYEYKMKTVYAHFPIKTKVSGEWLQIDNFLGEKTPRKARIMPGVKIKSAGEEVVITGPDVEAVSQTAANIEQACKIRGFDPRVFQDGIFITAKGA